MLDYADNPDKTTPQRYLDSDLYDTLKYAANDAKTDRTVFVAGINCSKQNAYGEMVAVQKRFGNRGSGGGLSRNSELSGGGGHAGDGL